MGSRRRTTAASVLALLTVLTLLILTPAVGHADSKGKAKGGKAPAPAPARSVSYSPPPPPPPPAPTVPPAPTAQPGQGTTAASAAEAVAQASASGTTITTEQARTEIAAQGQPASEVSGQAISGTPSPLTLRPTPAAAGAAAAETSGALSPLAARAAPNAPTTVQHAALPFTLPSWPYFLLLGFSVPLVALIIVFVRRAAPMVQFLNAEPQRLES